MEVQNAQNVSLPTRISEIIPYLEAKQFILWGGETYTLITERVIQEIDHIINGGDSIPKGFYRVWDRYGNFYGFYVRNYDMKETEEELLIARIGVQILYEYGGNLPQGYGVPDFMTMVKNRIEQIKPVQYQIKK